MNWHWVPDPRPATWVERSFPTQGEAETWLGEFYLEWVDAGVRTVSLYEADRLVYGPMRIDAEAS